MQEQAAALPDMVERRLSTGSAACTPLLEKSVGGSGGSRHKLLQIPDLAAPGALEEAQMQTPGNGALALRSPQLQSGGPEGASGNGAQHHHPISPFAGQPQHQVSAPAENVAALIISAQLSRRCTCFSP